MSAIETLVDEFAGTENWERFVETCRQSRPDSDRTADFVQAIGHEDIAIALMACLGEDALDWINRPIAALDGRTPLVVLKGDVEGVTVIKAIVMRLPV